ncbi:MFS general substrate transporter [Glarea lozoyensis ATCC 20868]|uniref:MFS general substrate transporter n=1 Tax=Glarea lozoyensis (strain ATCC 20868 / MF5171) TaxID=1116229 RepID=S3DB47_GLAL2|nr:MFS general substrate transporter [Glarea lozoyensis ATCC 20868]EPE35697.1 MFS general substrate transporter [Glarea lozoyensis ATCC 20868]
MSVVPENKPEAIDGHQVKETEVVPHVVEVYSVFSSGMRLYLTYLLGIVLLISTLTSTIYAPLLSLLSTHFSVSIQSINLTVTVYAIFQALSPAFFASLADAFGRRPVLLGVLAIYACASLGLTLNKSSYGVLLALRALQSIGGSATVPIAYGIVADVAVPSQRGKMLGPIQSTCNAICAVSPVIGGAIALGSGGVVWVFLSLLIIAVLLLVLVAFTLPETARNVVGNGSLPVSGIWRTWMSFISHTKRYEPSRKTCLSEPAKQRVRWRPIQVFTSFRIILYPDAASILLMIAPSYAVYYTFQAAVPVIFSEVYQYNTLEIGLALMPVLAGLTGGGILAGKLLDMNYAKFARKCNIDTTALDKNNLRDFHIEAARYRHCLPFILSETALIIAYGWVVQLHVHPALPMILQFFICATSTVMTYTAAALLVDVFPESPSTAFASAQIARCGVSAASVAILQPLIDAVGRGWYFTIFGSFVGLLSLVSLAVTRTKGMKWRQSRQQLMTPNAATQDVRKTEDQEPQKATTK